MLADGSYEGLVVDVDGTALSITIISGPHKGDVVDVRSASLHSDDAIDLLGMPCVLTVAGGEPSVVFD